MNPNLIMLLAGGGVFALLVIGIFLSGGEDGDKLKKRLDRVGGAMVIARGEQSRAQQSLRRSTTDSAIPVFDKLIKALMPNPDKLRQRLARTGRAISLGEYLLVNVLVVGVAYLGLSFFGHMAHVQAIFLAIAIGLYLPHMVVGMMGARRLKKFLASFPEAIDTLCRGLRSGLPVTESIAAVGREMPDPIGVEFRRISDGVRMGRPLEDSMWEVAKRIDTPEFRFLIISMTIQKETGGNLAETLGNLSDLIRRRRQLKMKIKAMSSEATASAMIIGSLPFVMFILLWFVNRDYIMTLFITEKGHQLIAFGFGMIGMGWAVMQKMISFEI